MNARRLRWMVVVAMAATTAMPIAHAFDMLQVQRDISATAVGPMLTSGGNCQFATPGRPLQLSEVVERALCDSPQTRAAWADVKARTAGVGIARAAYLPKVSIDAQGVRQSSAIDVHGQPSLGTNYTANVHSEGLSLSWVLLDFGDRSAALKNAQTMLEAARYTQAATLQTVSAEAAKRYYTAQAAKGALDAAREIERMTRRSMIAAQAKVDSGVAPITDALQAQTQHEQAAFSLAKAQGDAHVALGELSSAMGLAPDTPLEVPPVSESASPLNTFGESVSELIREVRDAHPAVRAAEAQYEAALAKVTQSKAQGLPNVSLVAKYTLNNQPQGAGLGLPTYPSTGREAYLGVQISIPLFEGFGRGYQIDQAQAQAERDWYALEDVRRRAMLDVWNSYYALGTATENVGNSTSLLSISQRAFDAALRRYESGVGSILELMNTQSALAIATQRRVQALADWGGARFDLAAKLGQLDVGNSG
ncbi:Protein CyaE [Burkholderia sp. 8Y]|uniref:TolC family protein n=1 Tax=Burkholderia sp. 8Y TaxID=2653133 RepID=UPI0012F2BCC8|nr:TolC family protein [Burkholderia sp. 8Y]VXB55512.1 Protein CyaE [Burkholderia sp. 8Y]